MITIEKRVIVRGKARSRIALGMVTAYLQLYPKTTFEELKAAFPDSICPKAPVQFRSLVPLGVFQPLKVVQALPKKGLNTAHFTNDDEVLTTGDGVAIAVTKSWAHDTFSALVAAAKKYGIEAEMVADEVEWPSGLYELEFLDTPTRLEGREKKVEKGKGKKEGESREKRKSRNAALMVAISLIIILLAAATLLWLRREAGESVHREHTPVDSITIIHPAGDKPVVMRATSYE